MTINDMQPALEGIRILDFCVMMAGQISTQPLADYGAQVIVIESHTHSRAVRLLSRRPGSGAPNLSSPNLSHYFNKFNTNKLSLTINLKNPRGLDIVKRLVKASDAAVDNLRPGVMESLGLGYKELVKIKPDIIVLSSSAMGQTGPHRDFRSLSWNLQSLAGWNYMAGYPDRPPINPSPHSHPDHSSSPFHGTIALLAALCYRGKSGKGQFIDLSQFEAAICFTDTAIFEYMVNNRLPQQMGNRLENTAPHGVYRCKGEERWCAISVFTSEEWEALCYAIGKPELIYDDRFSTLPSRLKHVEELDMTIEEWTSQRTAEEVMKCLQKAGISAGVVQNVKDLLLNDPQLKERGHWVKIEHPEAGPLILEEWGFRLSDSDRAWQPAPLLGQHNDYVLREILNLSEEEVNQLIIEGVTD